MPEIIYFPLLDSIKNSDEEKIKSYCSCIERLWKDGDDEVLNVVEVSILECLTDDKNIWQIFGGHISGEFKNYINNVYLKENNWLDIELLK